MKVSVLGDSISTFAGWSNNVIDASVNNTNYYPINDSSVGDVSKTWWAEACRQIGGTMVSNDAIGGSCVGFYGTIDHLDKHLGPDWCMSNPARINDLGSPNIASPNHPDLIMFYGGTNDACQDDYSTIKFNSAYTDAIRQMFNRYSSGITILCVSPYYSSEFYGQVGSLKYTYYLDVCDTIEGIVAYFRQFGYDCKFVSLKNMKLEEEGKLNHGHPNANGMRDIANKVADIQNHGY